MGAVKNKFESPCRMVANENARGITSLLKGIFIFENCSEDRFSNQKPIRTR